MNYQEPLRTSNVDLNKIVYPKTKNGGTKKLILIKYNDKSKLKNFVFQTPTLLNLFKPELNGNYADIEIGLVGKEKNKVNKFKKFLNELENKIKSDAQYYAASWFNLENDNQTINFQKIVRDSDKHVEGTIKLKIIKNNDFETILQLNNNKRIGVGAIPEDSWCKMILECYGVWVNTNNDFGIFFRPILVSYTPKEKEVYNYKFIEDSDEDNDVDIPDTEVNQNIFMKIDSSNGKHQQKQSNDSTSQLDYNELMRELESEDNKKTSEIRLSILHSEDQPQIFKRADGLLDINLENRYYSESDSDSELGSSSSSEEKSNSPNIDAETSDS
jgi:hypothetical protein